LSAPPPFTHSICGAVPSLPTAIIRLWNLVTYQILSKVVNQVSNQILHTAFLDRNSCRIPHALKLASAHEGIHLLGEINIVLRKTIESVVEHA
jgi:hypothetical protein